MLLSQLYSAEHLVERGVDLSDGALVDGTGSMSWADVIGETDRLAATLQSVGVAPLDRVAVRMTKSMASFVAVHAVIRAGAVMVPVDPMSPPDHAKSVIDDAGVSVLITDLRPASLVVAAGCDGVTSIVTPIGVATADQRAMLRPDQQLTDADELADASTLVTVDARSGDPAYIIYTSGSTGRPKGIVHSHESAMAYAAAAADAYGLTAADRFANIAPLHFDQSTFELYCAPLVGAAVLVVPEPMLRFPASLSALIERERITVWYSVPYLLAQLSVRGVLDERDLSSVRWVLFGGEAFPPGQLATLMRQLPSAVFSNVYGPAEVNQCTVFNLTAPPVEGVPVPIGVAWNAAALRVVDPDDQTRTMPSGAVGVLLVATPTMMSGYWNRPDLTEAAIVDESFSLTDADGASGTDGDGGAPGSTPTRWYRTGDLVVERADGNLEFLGRVDNQIKLRGHRIELEAIDLVMGDIDEVEAGTVVVDRPVDGDDRLIALVTAADSSLDDTSGLAGLVSQVLRSRLPRYAVPSEIRVVVALPRTATGKVDRSASARLVQRVSDDDRSEPEMI